MSGVAEMGRGKVHGNCLGAKSEGEMSRGCLTASDRFTLATFLYYYTWLNFINFNDSYTYGILDT